MRTRHVNITDNDITTVNYRIERLEDREINRIKTICLGYLADHDTSQHDVDMLVRASNFVSSKHEYVLSLRDRMRLPESIEPITNISRIVDSITLDINDAYEKNRALLTNEINNFLETSAMCYGILEMMIEEKTSDTQTKRVNGRHETKTHQHLI